MIKIQNEQFIFLLFQRSTRVGKILLDTRCAKSAALYGKQAKVCGLRHVLAVAGLHALPAACGQWKVRKRGMIFSAGCQTEHIKGHCGMGAQSSSGEG